MRLTGESSGYPLHASRLVGRQDRTLVAWRDGHAHAKHMSNHLFVEQNAITVEEDRIPDAAVLEVDVVSCGDTVEAARIPRPERRAPVNPAAPLVDRRNVGHAEHGADLETPDGPGRTAGHAVDADRAQYSQHDGLAVPVVERKPDARRRAHEA